MTSSVSIGGVVFSGDATNPLWVYQHLQGWYSAPPLRADSPDYPNSDGASPVDVVYRSARPLKFEGVLSGPTSQSAIANWMAFAAIQSNGVPVQLVVTDPFGVLSMTVSLAGVPEVTEMTSTDANVSVSMIAYDPIKYGSLRTLGTGLSTPGGGLEYPLHSGGAGGALYYGSNGTLGRVTLTNAGTATVWPTVTITGGLASGFYVQKLTTGQVVRYDRTVPDGSTIAINFRTGEVLVDGQSDGSTYLTRYEFFSAAPGESFDVQFNAIGGSSGTPSALWGISDGFW